MNTLPPSILPPLNRPFAYQSHAGQTILVEEIAEEIVRRLETMGQEVSPQAVLAVMRAFRHVTERVAQGDEISTDDIPRQMTAALRRQRVLMGDEQQERILHLLMQCLAAADVAGVTYFER